MRSVWGFTYVNSTKLIIWLVAVLTQLVADPARADDISATGRGVVRVVTIASADGEVVGFGHGSGFAVAPNRIVTNAHVVELAARYPDNVVIGVVPSEGAKSYQGRLVAYDAQRDLAMIEFSGASLPPTTLYPGPVADGEAVIALGYPGNVDLATAQSAEDYIRPLGPVRSQGGFAGRRSLEGTEVLLHTASIARGNSGGPLLDQCGRVIGVNSAVTKTEEGDSSFGFAIADSELAGFLRDASQPYQSTGVPCTSLADSLKQDQDAAAQAAEVAEREARAVAERTAREQAIALDNARLQAERTRENVIAVAAVLLVMGALAIGGAGLFETRGNRRPALWALGAGVALLLAALIIFILRPTGSVMLPDPPATPAPAPAKASYGKMLCRIVPERSRINLSTPGDVTIDWQPGGCVNGRTQYGENGSRWDRILVPAEEQTVSVLEYDPGSSTYTNTRYLLSADQMDVARKLRAQISLKACSTDEPARQQLMTQQSAIRSTLPPQPDEWLVYHCSPAPTVPQP